MMLPIQDVSEELTVDLKSLMSEALAIKAMLPKEVQLIANEDYEMKDGNILIALSGTQKLLFLLTKRMIANAHDVYEMKKK